MLELLVDSGTVLTVSDVEQNLLAKAKYLLRHPRIFYSLWTSEYVSTNHYPYLYFNYLQLQNVQFTEKNMRSIKHIKQFAASVRLMKRMVKLSIMKFITFWFLFCYS